MREHREHDDSSLIAECLHPTDGRRLRAQAWRHIRRLDAGNARRIWRAVRERDMSINRYAKKRDTSEPAIISALERCGFEVFVLDQPCDLAVRKSTWPGGVVQLIEVKTAYGKLHPKARKRADQEAQAAFIESTGTPVVTNPIEALRALNVVSEGIEP